MGMRVVVVAPGSRGDVQPYVALGKGLQAAGMPVRVVTTHDHEELVVSHGLEYWPIPMVISVPGEYEPPQNASIMI
jgi:UDP:flavonoid glycosyltransferase YjiC (YdhE family)